MTPSYNGGAGTYSKFNIIEDMGNGRSALAVILGTTLPVYVFKLPGAVTSPEKRLPLPAAVKSESIRQGTVYDIRGRRVVRPSRSGIYLYVTGKRVEKRIDLR